MSKSHKKHAKNDHKSDYKDMKDGHKPVKDTDHHGPPKHAKNDHKNDHKDMKDCHKPVKDTDHHGPPKDHDGDAHHAALISADVDINILKHTVEISADVLDGHSLLDVDVGIGHDSYYA